MMQPEERLSEAAGIEYRKWVAGRRRGAGALRLLIVSVFISCLVGCASTGLPTAIEKTAISTGEKAIVLLRAECVIGDQTPYQVFSNSLTDDNVSFGLGSFETGGEPKRLEILRFLSPESRRNGWTYFILEHGTYYLAVYPPRRTDALSYQRGLKNAPRWRIDVPRNAGLVYAGTLRFAGESDRLLFGGRILKSIHMDTMSVANDEALARKLLIEHFPGLGEVHVVLLKPHKGTIILHSPLPSPAR
jgi:hypothetical protein